MTKIGFEQHGNSICLVYELGPEDNVDSMSLGMLMNNRIPGFAPAVLTQLDDKKRIKYDVTARVPATQYLLGTVNKKQILGVFSGIVRALLSAEDYMIDVRTIQLELGSIFSDVATADTVLLCLPIIDQQTESAPDLNSFFKNILFNAQYDGRENRDYVAKLMSYLNGTPAFSLAEFKGILDYLMVESAPKESQPQPQVAPVAVGAGSCPDPNAAQIPPPVAPMNSGQTPQAPPMLPPVQRQTSTSPTGGAQQGKLEDQISLFYLLQHYNKDNAAKYKAQKEAKKADKQEKKGKKKEPNPQKQKGSAGFTVPGQAKIPSAPAGGGGCAVPQAQPQQPAPQAAPAYAAPQVQRPVQTPPQQPVPQAVLQPAAPVYTAPPAPQRPVEVSTQQPVASQPAAAVIDETLYFSEKDGDETVLLGSETQAQKLSPYLVRKRNNERIPISKAIFRLGRDAEYNDYAVTDNRYIGHGHCHIVIRDGEYFVVDDNSKNHTKVNGAVVTPGIEVKIAHGYTICLADEDFEFRLY